MENKIIYWSVVNFNIWIFYMAATNEGLCFVGSLNGEFTELAEWAQKKLVQCKLLQNDTLLQPYKEQFIEYFSGKRKSFTFPIEFHGTPFQQSVWLELTKIPYGSTYSYSDIANFLQKPNSVRAVASAIGANPVLITIPCHRVIGKNGKLTGFRGGLEMKEELLKLENIHLSSTISC
ncbi:methylated-DNA--[protein]-cysteine S-methyltransferase [Bacillus sp. BRMEA1]|uniref:methylated-DNA--[protein]-cysteine S-methyltransferase n=1 Tax=Neobacillus endophyticus TaxID=2738405 RepID=UPI0015639081|nr:methylated-DNA--[protein]-cysteine S-methyltransferase [Neobacillus endophyticus]NRD79662.1 methylated-DNA--[protein]-cysteine S-methyltransferase [Neobacillus endophyticus]